MNFYNQDVFTIICDKMKPEDFMNLVNCCTESKECLSAERFEQWRDIRVLRAAYISRKGGVHQFITGSAGSGKSFALQRICNENNKRGIQTHIVSPTGISATNFDEARTIHSFFGIPMHCEDTSEIKRFSHETIMRIITTRVLLIDEISMVSGNTLEMMDQICQRIRQNDRSMGGITVVVSGDFFQLPPINENYAFESEVWRELNPKMVRLPLSVRHKSDMPYYLLLQRLRVGILTRKDIKALNGRTQQTLSPDVVRPVKLFTNNALVNETNEKEFDQLTNPVVLSFNAVDRVVELIYDGTYVPTNKMYLDDAINYAKGKLHKYPDTIKIKVGAQYLITSNIATDLGVANGASCVVVSVAGHHVTVQLTDGSQYMLVPKSVKIKLRENLYLERTQYPLRLGYAVTIHNSQGMTLTKAVIDLKGTFAVHQVYVALSRVESLKGLYLKNFNTDSIFVSRKVKEYYDKHA